MVPKNKAGTVLKINNWLMLLRIRILHCLSAKKKIYVGLFLVNWLWNL